MVRTKKAWKRKRSKGAQPDQSASSLQRGQGGSGVTDAETGQGGSSSGPVSKKRKIQGDVQRKERSTTQPNGNAGESKKGKNVNKKAVKAKKKRQRMRLRQREKTARSSQQSEESAHCSQRGQNECRSASAEIIDLKGSSIGLANEKHRSLADVKIKERSKAEPERDVKIKERSKAKPDPGDNNREKDRNSDSADRKPSTSQAHGTSRGKYGESESAEQNQSDIKQRIFDTEELEQSFIVLNCEEVITVQGRVQFRVVVGSVTVLGHRIDASEKFYPLYSPNCSSLMTIRANSHNQEPDESHLLESKPTMREHILRTWTEVDRPGTIVEFKALRSRACDFLTTVPLYSKLFDVVDQQSHIPMTSGVSVLVDDNVRKFMESREFIHAKNLVIGAFKAEGTVTVAVCGGKKAGKSTFARYLVNTLLNHTAEVAFLECDVGQTEFTPPGCVSLTVVTAPLFGPPFTHQTSPRLCKYFGLSSPADDPAAYVSLVVQTFQHYQRHYSHLPLVVNTMGWNKGIGPSLLVDTLRTVRPSFIIQLHFIRESHNLPPLLPAFVADTPGWLTSPIGENGPEIRYELIQLESESSKHVQYSKKYSPWDHRNLALLSYFSQLNNMKLKASPCPLQAVHPYKIRWSALAIHVCTTPVPYEQLMYAINCSVVALCRADPDKMSQPEKEDHPRFFQNSPDAECLGFGIVRGVDPVQKVVYILTPLAIHRLANVNTLVRGGLELPPHLLMKQKVERGELPYTGYTLDSLGAWSIKPRKHIRRGNNQRDKPEG